MAIEQLDREGFMDFLFLAAVALMCVAMLGMVIGCEQLGGRQ